MREVFVDATDVDVDVDMDGDGYWEKMASPWLLWSFSMVPHRCPQELNGNGPKHQPPRVLKGCSQLPRRREC